MGRVYRRRTRERRPPVPLLLGPELWLRADLGITLNGSNVAAWADQSGNGHDFTNAAASEQPAYDGTEVSFDAASGEVLTCSSLQKDDFNSTDFEWFFITEGATFRAGGQLAGLPRLYLVDSRYSYSDLNNVTYTHTSALQALSFGHDGTNAYVRRNNVELNSAAVAQFSGGGGDTALGETGSGHDDTVLREVILFLRTPSAPERAQLQAYFAARYGL